jgi:hypothetical protein
MGIEEVQKILWALRAREHLPEWVKSEEDYHRWMVITIQEAALELAEPHIAALTKIALNKPPLPIYFCPVRDNPV